MNKYFLFFLFISISFLVCKKDNNTSSIITENNSSLNKIEIKDILLNAKLYEIELIYQTNELQYEINILLLNSSTKNKIILLNDQKSKLLDIKYKINSAISENNLSLQESILNDNKIKYYEEIFQKIKNENILEKASKIIRDLVDIRDEDQSKINLYKINSIPKDELLKLNENIHDINMKERNITKAILLNNLKELELLLKD
jgi:hypothetical protein